MLYFFLHRAFYIIRNFYAYKYYITNNIYNLPTLVFFRFLLHDPFYFRMMVKYCNKTQFIKTEEGMF